MNRVLSQWKARLGTPAYRIGEAATYAKISPQTVASWGRQAYRRNPALTERAEKVGFSFYELIEIAVVAELRRQGVKLADISAARDYFSKKTQSPYPFATEAFKTDGVDILLDERDSADSIIADRLLTANSNGQLVWSGFLKKKLDSFNYDSDGDVIRWRVGGPDSDVIIDPRLSFGSPSIGGVMTRAIKNERRHTESIIEIAENFDLSPKQVVEALVFEGLQLNTDERKWLN